MSLDPVTIISNLGSAGFAMFILWKMSQEYQKRSKEKDHELIAEIDKRDIRNELQQRVFHEFASQTQLSMSKHINDNTKALEDFTKSVQENTTVTHELSRHLVEHHSPIVNQFKIDGK